MQSSSLLSDTGTGPLPHRARLYLNALCALLLAVGLLYRPALAPGIGLSFMPAAVMVIALLRGWVFAAAAAVVACGADAVLLPDGQWQDAVVLAVAGLPCAELLRRGMPPLAIAGLLALPALLLCLPEVSAHGTAAGLAALAGATGTASIDVSLATAALVFIPHRGDSHPAHCRARIAHVVFAVVVNTVWLGVLLLVAVGGAPPYHTGAQAYDPTAAVRLCVLGLATLAGTVALTHALERAARRLTVTNRTGPDTGPRLLRIGPAEVPHELAGALLCIAHEAMRLRIRVGARERALAQARSLIHRRGKELEDARRTILQLSNAVSAHKAMQGRYEALMAHLPQVVLFADEGGIIRGAGQAAAALLGYEPAELIGKPVGTLIPPDHVLEHPLDLSSHAGADSHASAGSQAGAALSVEAPVLTRDAKTINAVFQVETFQVDGARHRAIQVSRPVSARRSAPGGPDHTPPPYQQRSLFIAMMSHEVRTPLHSLVATLDLLRNPEQSPEEYQHRLSIARTSARSLLKIANDFLDLSKIDTGHFRMERRNFSLAAVLQEVVEGCHAHAQSLGLRMTVDTADALPPSFVGDPARLRQILENLVSNALKFTSHGLVSLQVQYDGRACCIDVRDTGAGIPHDKWESIFEPFEQVELAPGRSAGGTGLGLPISRRLAEAMGGSLTLLQSGPSGSTFRLFLPLEASQEAAPEEQSQRILVTPHANVLVVEDNPSNRYVAQALLDGLKCPATIVESGARALEVLQTGKFDIILMDCQMPGMDGCETTRRVRRLPGKRIPIIAMTADALPEDKQRCLEAGMDDFLVKPFRRAGLNEILCKWLVDGGGRRADGRGGTTDVAQLAASLPVLDMPMFNELRSSLQWKKESLNRICSTFTEAARKVADSVESASAADHRTVLRLLHTLLGSAGMVGARQLEYLAGVLQSAVKANQPALLACAREALRPALARFEREFERCVDVEESAETWESSCH